MKAMQALISVLVLCCALPAAAQTAPEQFRGQIVDAGGAVPGATSTHFTIHIDEYATAEEVMELAKVLIEEGDDALEKKLWKLDRGYIRIGSSLGYPLAVARSLDTEDGRIIRVVTDRPIQFFEVRHGLRSEDYMFGVIEIKLPEDGLGEGVLIAAAKVEFKDGKVEIESFGIQPFKLRNVKVEMKKEKKKKKDKG